MMKETYTSEKVNIPLLKSQKHQEHLMDSNESNSSKEPSDRSLNCLYECWKT